MSQDISTERLDELIGSQQRQIAGADFNGMPFMATENREILPALLELKRRRDEVIALRKDNAMQIQALILAQPHVQTSWARNPQHKATGVALRAIGDALAAPTIPSAAPKES